MDDLHHTAPTLHYRVHRLKQRTLPLWPANENRPGATVATATLVAIPARAGVLRRVLRAIGHGLRRWYALRMIQRLETWPDHRLAAIGIAHGEIEPAVRRLFGLQPGQSDPRDRAGGRR